MKSNYKALSELVERVDIRNSDGGIDELIGVSIEKCFIKSVANTIGTDLTKYKIIKKNEFAVSLMQVSRDAKIPIACLKDYEIAIMSPAYSIFRVKNEQEVLPEYLDLWFRRSEFDREAAFIAVGGVRGSMPWDEFTRMEVFIPEYEEQHRIVNSYKAISDRIALKRQINDNLAAMARTFFQSLFAPYTTINEDELPSGWSWAKIGDYCNENVSNISSADTLRGIIYLDTGSVTQNYFEPLRSLTGDADMPSRAKRKVSHGDIVYSTVRPNLKHYGIIYNPPTNMVVSTGFAVLHNNGQGVSNELLYMWITNDSISEYLQSMAENSVSTYPTLGVADLLAVKIAVPDRETLEKANYFFGAVFLTISDNNRELQQLISSQDVLIPRLLAGGK